jgi:hypothetical protein
MIPVDIIADEIIEVGRDLHDKYVDEKDDDSNDFLSGFISGIKYALYRCEIPYREEILEAVNKEVHLVMFKAGEGL